MKAPKIKGGTLHQVIEAIEQGFYIKTTVYFVWPNPIITIQGQIKIGGLGLN